MIFIFSVSVDRDRMRYDFEENERKLMAEVRRLRTKLATESRNKKPPLHA